jgi:type II secretory ATPase GspE/PulE/Tfp pilus assembly ATPase PilB-like protein
MVQFNDKITNARINTLRHDEEEKLVQALAPQYGFEYINLQGYTINPGAVALVKENKARAGNLAVFEMTHNLVSVAVKNPNNPITLQVLEELQNNRQTIKLFMTSSQSLEHAWKRYADLVNTSATKKGVFDIDAEEIVSFSRLITKKEDVGEQMKKVATINNSRRVTETLELILAGAIGLKSSDIHIEPEENVVRMRYRLDGVLHDIFDIDRFIYERIMSRLKLLSGMALNKRAEAQDGRFTFEVGDKEIDVRSSIIPGAAGESIVMRLLDAGVAGFSFDKLQLNHLLKKALEIELKKPNGLIITTGPTGSGKTTALYSFLRETHEEGVKIITIENPVEYKLEGIVQTQTSQDYTFSSGLRAVLRQDPDIIMVGEIRDREVAETAIHAAQTGHLVFSTLHTNSAVASFARLIDLGIDPRILGSALNAVLGQRLVRRLCENCKKSYLATPEEFSVVKNILMKHPALIEVRHPLNLYKAQGCEKCGMTGYKGRVGIFEAVLMDEAVEEAILRDPREHVILAAAENQKIPTMIEDGMEKVFMGATSLEELARVIEIPITKAEEKSLEKPDDTDLFLSHVVT